VLYPLYGKPLLWLLECVECLDVASVSFRELFHSLHFTAFTDFVWLQHQCHMTFVQSDFLIDIHDSQ